MNRGLTLSEALISIALFGLIVVVLVALFVSQNGLLTQSFRVASVQQQLARSMSVFTQWTSQGVAVTNYPTINPTVSSGPNSLVLTVPSIDSNNAIIPNTYDTVIFSRPSATSFTAQVIASGAGRKTSTTTLATSVSDLIFVYNKPVATDASRVSFRISLNPDSIGISPLASERSVYLRNHP